MDSDTIQNQTADKIGYDAYFALIHMQSVGLAYGLYVSIAVAALQITWRRHARCRVKRTSTRWILGLFTLIFLSTTAWFSVVAAEQYLKFQYIFRPVNGNTPTLKERQQVVELLFEKLFSASPFLQGINASLYSSQFIAADSIIVWRALSLWPEKRFLRYVFGFWIFASASIAIANGFHTVAINIRAAGDATKVNGWQKLDSSSMLVSLSINIAATTLILVKVWQTRQMWGHTNLDRSTPYRILITLIECGLVFCAVQAINASVSLNNGNSSSLGSLEMFVQSFAVMSPILAGLYPSIVLLIVRQQSAIDGETDVFIFENTMPKSEPKFDLTQHGHGNDASGRNLTSVIRFTSQASDLESGNGTSSTFWSRGDTEGLGGSHAHRGEDASDKDERKSDRRGAGPPGEGFRGERYPDTYRASLPVEADTAKDTTPRAL